MVRRRDDFGLDRPGPGVGDADLDGGLHGDARPTAARASRRIWSRRWTTGTGLKPVPAAGAAVEGRRHARRSSQAIRDGHVGGRQRRSGTGGRARDRRARTSAARPAPRRSSRTPAASRRRRGTSNEPARPRLVRLLRAARQSGDRRRRLPRARHPRRRTPPRSRSTSSPPTSRRRTASRCRRRRRASRCASTTRIAFARRGGGPAGGGQ